MSRTEWEPPLPCRLVRTGIYPGVSDEERNDSSGRSSPISVESYCGNDER
jgi:hypothetical protein